MRSILVVPLADAEASAVIDLALDTAATAQKALRAVADRGRGVHITGLIIRPTVETFMPTGDFGLALSQEYLSKAQQDNADQLRSLFETTANQHQIPHPDAADRDAVSLKWLEAEGPSSTVVGNFGRLCDLIIVARPSASNAAPEMLFESALFETGHPVLVAPPGYRCRGQLGRTVALAWNGSTETARALAFSMPLLAYADHVFVISLEGGLNAGPAGSEAVTYLNQHGISATSRHAELMGQTQGERFIAEALELGCDWMIKGAYTQSRLRQMIFGGATRHILNAATMPVFMAN